MKFIFRNPFVTKRSKADGADIMHCAGILFDAAEMSKEMTRKLTQDCVFKRRCL